MSQNNKKNQHLKDQAKLNYANELKYLLPALSRNLINSALGNIEETTGENCKEGHEIRPKANTATARRIRSSTSEKFSTETEDEGIRILRELLDQLDA